MRSATLRSSVPQYQILSCKFPRDPLPFFSRLTPNALLLLLLVPSPPPHAASPLILSWPRRDPVALTHKPGVTGTRKPRRAAQSAAPSQNGFLAPLLFPEYRS
ncbi:hypothetical protein E2C01_070960 [Portunus trituberculatus]|uniref:Uncharacterized protein n=1 Tax=Portunus trituberculatus TaxID=210409 RepID=A0A5B7I2R6_PORTR|nr:hypothetical protein [Portunus trituberculatus]